MDINAATHMAHAVRVQGPLAAQPSTRWIDLAKERETRSSSSPNVANEGTSRKMLPTMLVGGWFLLFNALDVAVSPHVGGRYPPTVPADVVCIMVFYTLRN